MNSINKLKNAMNYLKRAVFAFLVVSIGIFIYQSAIAASADDNVTIKGVFTDVTRPVVKFKTDDGTEYQVHVGPYWFWDENKYSLQVNSNAEVFGKKESGSNEIYAFTIMQDGKTIKLVDDNNNPLWWKSGTGNNKGRNDCYGNRKGRGNGRGPCNGTGPRDGTGSCWR